MATAIDVANVFLKLSQPEAGDTISNLKLQKLLYYAQGFHLAFHGSVLFPDPIVAWQYGPVVESVYHNFKHFGYAPIDVPENINEKAFTESQLDLIKEINEVYGQFSALKLMNLTHQERPWKETESQQVISETLMKEFFLTQIQK